MEESLSVRENVVSNAKLVTARPVKALWSPSGIGTVAGRLIDEKRLAPTRSTNMMKSLLNQS